MTRTAVSLVCLLLALLAEGLGISTLLTVLVVVVGGEPSPGAEAGQLERAVRAGLDLAGVEPTLGNLLVLFVCATVLQAGLVLLAQRHVGFTVARVATDLRLLLVRALSSARWSYFTQRSAGSLASSISGEVGRAVNAYLNFMKVVSIAAQGVLYASLALLVSWKVTVAACLAACILMLSMRGLITAARNAALKSARLTRLLLRHLSDALQAVKPLKAMAREARMGPILEREARRIEKASRKQIVARELMRSVQLPMNAIFIASGIYVAVTYWQVPVAELGVLVILFTSTVSKLTSAQRQYQQMATDAPSAAVLQEQIQHALENRELDCGTQPPLLERAVTLEGVDLRYGDNRVLEGASLEVPAGQITAILGPSGAGKTSLADLLCGLVSPDRGSVRLDGVALEEIDLRAWRRTIGYVPQEVFLINDSVRENVALGEDLPEEEIVDALRRAGAGDFLSELPEGLDSPVGERGSRLSGGQRQRICIARALVHRPRLLILDEATTALDPETEAKILGSIEQLRGEVTVLAISHQPQLTSIADRIYRLEAGKIHPVEAERA